MEKCIKCGATLPTGAKLCPSCGNPVSFYEEKKQAGSRFSSVISPRAAVQAKQARERSILILALVALSGLLVLSLAFALVLWAAPPKLVVSSSSLDYGRLQVGSEGSQTLTLSNSGRQDLNWKVAKGKADWLTLDPSQGRIPPGGLQTIHVQADTTLLAAGHYSASIGFTSNGGEVSVRAVLTVVSRPVVTSIEPKVGPVAGGTIVTIQGVSFTGASHVLFGGTDASTFVVNSDTQITVASPAGRGTVHITVITPLDTTATSTADQFTYLPAPKIASIAPTAGPMVGGTRVTVRGSGFTGASKVLFGSIASSFTVNSDTQITAVSPAGSGTMHVTVITPGGTTATSTADQFTYQAAPKITRIQPTRGLITGGVNVIIRGTGFTRASQVLFGTTASTFTVSSDTQIIAVSPAGRGTVHITVTTPGGTSATSTADRFTYLAVPPKITSIAPTAGLTAGGTTVTIQGSSFTGASQVLFGTTASTFTVNSDTQITAVSPAGRGTVHITVTAPGGTSGASAHDQFTYLAAPPTIASISPTSGPAAGGTRVTIWGSGFTGASQVLFGSTARDFTVNSDTQITVVSPAGRGTVHITVITPLGTAAASAHDQFTYLTVPPTIASIAPTAGPAAGGTRVTIRGSGFTGANQILFGSTAASNFTVNSDTRITVVSPAGSGTVYITVITPGGSTAASSHDRFQYR